MSQHTNIQWADSTLNFWSGCTKVSAGCANCYAETLSNRKLTSKTGELSLGSWGKGAPRKRHQSAFNLALRLNKQPWLCDECGMAHAVKGQICMTKDCQCETRHRRRVFSLSLGDWLDPEVPIEWLAEMLDTIRQCDQVQWLLVTKRPELFVSQIKLAIDYVGDHYSHSDSDQVEFLAEWLRGNPPANVMVLTSVENQQAADERIPALLRIPAAQRGLSCEPLLGPLRIKDALRCDVPIHWVIIGGESGPGARRCHADWIHSLKDQCQRADVPVFVKQLGAGYEDPRNGVAGASVRTDKTLVGKLKHLTDPKGGDLSEWPAALRVRQWHK